MIRFNGNWINENDNRILKISGPKGNEDYDFGYENEEGEFEIIERIVINKSNEKHAHMASKNFGIDIIIINEDTIVLNNIRYYRK